MNRIKSIAAAGLAAVSLAACRSAEAPAPDTYEINRRSVENRAGRENGINDMLPALSEDTRVISVEEAEKLMPEDTKDAEEQAK